MMHGRCIRSSWACRPLGLYGGYMAHKTPKLPPGLLGLYGHLPSQLHPVEIMVAFATNPGQPRPAVPGHVRTAGELRRRRHRRSEGRRTLLIAEVAMWLPDLLCYWRRRPYWPCMIARAIYQRVHHVCIRTSIFKKVG